jgi:hypothetical protein
MPNTTKKQRYMRAYARAHADKFRKSRRKYLANPEARAKARAYARDYNQRNRSQRDDYRRRWEDRRRTEMMGRPPPDICELCGEASDKKLCADHCHKLGHPRGWLCSRCNLVLGQVGDDGDLLRKMIAYLAHHATNQSPQLILPGI